MRILPAVIIASLTATSAFAGSVNISPMPVDLAFPKANAVTTSTGKSDSTKAYVAPRNSVKSTGAKKRLVTKK